jgi:hypothetical protein
MLALSNFHEPGVWLVISVLCGVALLAGWSFTPNVWRPWLALFYWVAIPYLALLTGAVSPRLMGLRYMEAGAALLLVLVVLATAVRLLTVTPRPHPPTAQGLHVATWAAVVAAICLCGAEEFFWSFLRGALWEIALSLPQSIEVPAYWAVWVAALLALPLVLVLQPSASRRLVKTAILIVTSVVFFYTRNFWLCWLLHSAIWLLMVPLVHETPIFAPARSAEK